MLAGVIRAGAERVFLRVDADSALVDSSRAAGFFAYQHETLYRLARVPRVEAPEMPMRRREKKDHLGVFQLYGRIAPANVRAIEGATLREWQASQEKWGGRPRDFVLEEDGVISAQVRTVAGAVGRLGVLSSGGRDRLDDLVRFSLSRLKRSNVVFCLTSEHDSALVSALRDADFEADSLPAYQEIKNL